MQQIIRLILEKYPTARANQPFKGPHAISELFNALKSAVANLPEVKSNRHLVVKSSYGKGNWAAVPWLAILDTRETSTTQRGTYIVLLFREDGLGCHLKLAQGVTDVQKTHGARAPEELLRRASNLRESLAAPELDGFDVSGDGKLEAQGRAARLYDSSTIFSMYYPLTEIPSDESLHKNISALCSTYEKFINLNKCEEPEKTYESEQRRFWAISAGEGGRKWDDFQQNGEASINWEQLPSLENFSSVDAILEALLEGKDGESRPTMDALCCFQFCKEVSIGDVVVAKAGRKKILGIGIVTSDYYFDRNCDEHRHKRRVRWEVTTSDEFPGTGTATKTLTEITPFPGFVSHIKALLGEDTEEEDISERETERSDYSVTEILDEGCFLSEEEVSHILERLKQKKNIILQGPPGTGKTWLAKRLAYALIGLRSKTLVRTAQFHANLTYEDFIRGYRPSPQGGLSLVDGSFMTAIDDARNTSKPVVFVIEEINRGNPAQIFGEFLTLIEADKRSADEAIELTYKRSDTERISVPSNLYIIGTMNVADRSLAMIDLALRRRFAFINLSPNLNPTWRQWVTQRCGVPDVLASKIEYGIKQLNETIANDPSLGPQFMIGHSYVTPSPDSDLGNPVDWYTQVVRTEISPLLDEYWYDNLPKAQSLCNSLLNEL